MEYHTCLTKHVPERNQHRFYVLSVQPNLFGGWSLIREWGRIGSPGRVRIDGYASLDGAQEAYSRKLREKQRRGYGQERYMV
jgi:predicted DNA-binding WGR domain protein